MFTDMSDSLSESEIVHLKTWVGRTQVLEDVIAPDRITAMAATLDWPEPPKPGSVLPPGWHWLFFNGAARQSQLGPDGHPRRGGFLPPVSLPRRMWAGGRLSFVGPLKVGAQARRESQVASVEAKRGRAGDLVFVLVKHKVYGDGVLAIEEEHDIVYRAPPAPGTTPQPEAAPTGAAWRREVRPDPVLLFRYSALTFNGHRIHYDYPYVTKEEGYPGLIVHGPLIATLLLDLVCWEMPKGRLEKFEFRAVSPLFDIAPFTVNGIPAPDGGSAQLWAEGPDARLAMKASALFRP